MSFCNTIKVARRLSVLRRFTRSAHCGLAGGYSWWSHRCGELREEHVGESVTLCGWLRRPRVLGKLGSAFMPISDASGATQLVCSSEEWQHVLKTLTNDTVVKAVGVVRKRPTQNVNLNMDTGEVEVDLKSLEVLNDAPHLPFSSATTHTEVGEELQLRERQLYLRLPKMQHNIKLRSDVAIAMRSALIEHDFIEIETPTLFKRTPEGAREFIVPTRSPGQFFSLAQSPQQFKQLLMVAGFDRYFQFARCYRDEGIRPDRQPEFTQVDIEMSFVDNNGVMRLTEELVWSTVASTCPHLSLPPTPFPRMDYSDAMDRYGTDKPDTRYEIKLKNLDHVWRQHLEMSLDGGLTCMAGIRIPNWTKALDGLSWSERKELDMRLSDHSRQIPVAMATHDQLLHFIDESQYELASPLYSILSGAHPSSQLLSEQLKATLGSCPGDVCVVAACADRQRERETMLTCLGAWRSEAASILSQRKLMELDSSQLNFLWVTSFPLFTTEVHKNGKIVFESTHHPFTAPVAEHEHLLRGEPSVEQLAQVQGQHYDLVVNGVELGGGSIRVHQADLQQHILSNILKVSTGQFSHLLKGLKSGCPPHGGIALGFDRLMAVLCQADSLRDVIAFPKSFYGRDLLVGAPSELNDEDLATYFISVNYFK